ncbi:MAG: glycoside hydrolase family 43 protein [Mucilaginibacter polytrichastri]|nr:glycoside hydrolase family 43 protein [Mucilaginibacter polytrichastri]
MKKHAPVSGRLLVTAFFTLFFTVSQAQTGKAWLFSYFKNNGEDGLHLAYSRDGLHWTALKGDSSYLKPDLSKDKLMRDPCIIRGADGKFHMVWTISWEEKGIGYASSEDLLHWSAQKIIPVMENETGVRNCWAPEITYDPGSKTYLIYWSSTVEGKFPETQSAKENGYNHRVYAVSTKDFELFSPTEILYEPGFNVIDASIVQDGKRWMMLLKDETIEPAKKNIRLAFATKIEGPYSTPTPPVTGKYWAEGPTAMRINGKWRVYFDKYVDHAYGAVESADGKNWTDISGAIKMPEGIRHGSIFEVTEAELQKLGVK